MEDNMSNKARALLVGDYTGRRDIYCVHCLKRRRMPTTIMTDCADGYIKTSFFAYCRHCDQLYSAVLGPVLDRPRKFASL